MIERGEYSVGYRFVNGGSNYYEMAALIEQEGCDVARQNDGNYNELKNDVMWSAR